MSCLFMSERLLSGRKVVLRPERLTTDFEQVNGTLLMTLRWRMSQHALDPAAVEGFQFTWTLQSRVTTATEGLEDTVISQTQTVAPVREICTDCILLSYCQSKIYQNLKEDMKVSVSVFSWDYEPITLLPASFFLSFRIQEAVSTFKEPKIRSHTSHQ